MAEYASSPPSTGPGHRRGESRRTGQWKLAYADFFTALSALFLALWLTSEAGGVDRRALAEYFSSNASHRASAPNAQSASAVEASGLIDALSADVLLAPHLTLSKTPDRIVVDIGDRTQAAMFESGSATLTPHGRRLLNAFGAIVADRAEEFFIEGHTDPFRSRRPGYSNWNLSTARAETALSALIDIGVAPNRVRGVTGRADTRPLYPLEPHLPANRRVSIVFELAGE